MKPVILTISDGNGVENDFRKWPLLLKLLVSKTHRVINRSVVGASNELLFMQLSEAIKNCQIDFAIVQWTVPQRIDLLSNDFWQDQARVDPIYHFNIVQSNNQKWWVTSASTNEHIRQYHEKYINLWQARQRSQCFMMAAAELLKFHNIKFVFALVCEFEFIDPQIDILRSYPWIWHEANKGILEFRYTSKYICYDQNKSQPHPLIGLEWINQVVKPGCAFVDYDEKTYYNIEQALLKNV